MSDDEEVVTRLITLNFSEDSFGELMNWIDWHREHGNYVPGVGLDLLEAFKMEAYDRAVIQAQKDKGPIG